jgi:hypothetical protein
MSRARYISSSTRERPLGEVLAHAWGDFTPEHPQRAPWHQLSLDGVDVAITDNRVTVPLACAHRAQLHRLERPTYVRDDLEPLDWTPAGWGVSPSARKPT